MDFRFLVSGSGLVARAWTKFGRPKQAGQVTLMSSNQKHFEHNAQIDAIFDRLASANVPENKDVTHLIVEGKELIRKRQELIRIADESADDGWRVVDKAICDESASAPEDERWLKTAKEAANRKRRQATQGHHGPEKRTKTSLSSSDQQLFRGESTFTKFTCFSFVSIICVLCFLHLPVCI